VTPNYDCNTVNIPKFAKPYFKSKDRICNAFVKIFVYSSTTIQPAMKKYLVLTTILHLALLVKAQQVSVSMKRMNVAYVGIENPISVAVENERNSDIILETDNGRIDTTYSEFGNRFWPDRPGTATVTISIKTNEGLRKIGQQIIRVKSMPPPIASLAGKSNGHIAAPVLRLQIAPSANLMNFDIDARLPIYKFTVMVIRDSELVFERKHHAVQGARFDDVTLLFFKSLKPGDKLWIKEIAAGGLRGLKYPHLNDINIVVD
jgi:hypothetical protein